MQIASLDEHIIYHHDYSIPLMHCMLYLHNTLIVPIQSHAGTLVGQLYKPPTKRSKFKEHRARPKEMVSRFSRSLLNDMYCSTNGLSLICVSMQYGQLPLFIVTHYFYRIQVILLIIMSSWNVRIIIDYTMW